MRFILRFQTIVCVVLFWAGNAASEEACIGERSAAWSNCIGSDRTSEGSFFFGEFKGGYLDGTGGYFFAEENGEIGDIYLGEFKNGEFHGHGIYTFLGGNRYIGEFSNDQANGLGEFTNGEKYVGEFKDWKYHGQGTYTFSDGSTISGEFRDSVPNGYATFIHGKDGEFYGDRYVGEMAGWLLHGQGTYYSSNGTILSGQFLNDSANGFGKLIFGEGSDFFGATYSGEFKDWEFHGQGTYVYANGDKYTGEFREGEITGFGSLVFGEKSKFFGDRYVGEFKDGKFHGHGTLYFVDGKIKKGFWENGEYVSEIPERSPSNGAGNFSSNVVTEEELVQVSSGTGFAISRDGYIVTNSHVVKDCLEVGAHAEGNKFEATIISRDELNDLALLKTNYTPRSIFALGRGNPELLQEVFVAGFPFGKNVSSSVIVTKGIVSSLSGLGDNFSNLQIDAAIQPGNSGGPIIDVFGNVVGIVVSKLSLEASIERWGVVPENTNFGIKSNIAVNFLESNGVTLETPRSVRMSNSEIGVIIANGTFYLSCWKATTSSR